MEVCEGDEGSNRKEKSRQSTLPRVNILLLQTQTNFPDEFLSLFTGKQPFSGIMGEVSLE